MSQSYFITGTDTNVGKTYIASALLRHFAETGSVIGMKPIASGCELNDAGELENEDVVALVTASTVKAPLEVINPYRFAPAIAPHIAAEQAGVEVTLDTIVQAYQHLNTLADTVIVEGAGGFLVPINQKQTFADVAQALDLPIILVVGMRLGCINHALLTIDAIQTRGLRLAGWVANESQPGMQMFEENLLSLQQRISAPCLSVVRYQGSAQFQSISFNQPAAPQPPLL